MPTNIEKFPVKKRALIVLGMHRSGTSALTGSLEAGGVYLGETNHSTFDNLKGNRESKRVMSLHNDLLARSGGSWKQPVLQPKWEHIHLVLRDMIIDSYQNASIWGFKDPRTLFTLQGWLKVLPHAELIGIFRHPFYVAESLHVRNGMSHEDALELWLKYNQALLRLFWNRPNFPIIEFSDKSDSFESQLEMLMGELCLRNCREKFFEAKLRQTTFPNIKISDKASQALYVYERLRAIRIDHLNVNLASESISKG